MSKHFIFHKPFFCSLFSCYNLNFDSLYRWLLVKQKTYRVSRKEPYRHIFYIQTFTLIFVELKKSVKPCVLFILSNNTITMFQLIFFCYGKTNLHISIIFIATPIIHQTTYSTNSIKPNYVADWSLLLKWPVCNTRSIFIANMSI